MKPVDLALITGYECLAAWADLLDRINVFPVADGDTGANLRISLAPLKAPDGERRLLADRLSRAATGNSGNIAVAFLRAFAAATDPAELAAAAEQGRRQAWQAVARPQPGTMLSVFDTVAGFPGPWQNGEICGRLSRLLQQSVVDGAALIPAIRQAGVVDAGALAMYIFFDGFCQSLAGRERIEVDVRGPFAGRLEIDPGFFLPAAESGEQFCVDAVLATNTPPAGMSEALSELGDSVVLLDDAAGVKIHVHTTEPRQLRHRLTGFGEVIGWSDEPIRASAGAGQSIARIGQTIRVVSDAAGSLPRELAEKHGITLLDSYLVYDGQSRPESLCDPEEIYRLLRTGQRVTTAQASVFERRLRFQRFCQEGERTLYLCVGSAFTGNYDVAVDWKQRHDRDNRLEILDTGAASGRLGLITLLTGRFAESGSGAAAVVEFARRRLANCQELVFIDQLKYLVAGGRVSRAGGFFGDLLQLKPIISPTAGGVRREGVVRHRRGQLAFALERLQQQFGVDDRPAILLQYSDNRTWVSETVAGQLAARLPRAELILVPLSLTSGVHMGPGTWSVAWDLAD